MIARLTPWDSIGASRGSFPLGASPVRDYLKPRHARGFLCPSSVFRRPLHRTERLRAALIQLVMTRAEDSDGALCPAPDPSRLGGRGAYMMSPGSKRRPRPPLVAAGPMTFVACVRFSTFLPTKQLGAREMVPLRDSP